VQKQQNIFSGFFLILGICLLTTVSGFCSQLKVISILDILSYDHPPLTYEESRQTAGVATEIVEKILKKANTKYFITIYPFDESYNRAKSKENSMIYPLARTSEREFDFKWVGPIADNSIHLFQLQGKKKISIMALNTLNNFKVGVVKDSPAHKFLITKNITKNLNIEDKPETNINKLYDKQIDMLAGSELELLYQAKKLGLNHNNLSRIFQLIKNNGYYLGFNKFTSKDLLTEIKAAFDELESNGEIRIIQDNFLNK
jgi:polar amino acid transport system substrate-binding protein